MPDLTDHDYELLSAYLDEALSAAERALLEARLRTEPDLRAALDDLRVVQQAVASLPVIPAPRDLRLTYDMLAPEEDALIMAAPPMFDVLPQAAPDDDETPLWVSPPPSHAVFPSAPASADAPSAPLRATRAIPWWLVAAAVLTLTLLGGLFVFTQRPSEPPVMIAVASTATASPTLIEVIAPAAVPLLSPAAVPEGGVLRQLDDATEDPAPLTMQALAPPSTLPAAPESIPMLAAEVAPQANAADALDAPQRIAQTLQDGLMALLRWVLQLVLRL